MTTKSLVEAVDEQKKPVEVGRTAAAFPLLWPHRDLPAAPSAELALGLIRSRTCR
jgi:hypothetical protein